MNRTEAAGRKDIKRGSEQILVLGIEASERARGDAFLRKLWMAGNNQQEGGLHVASSTAPHLHLLLELD
jgi:hypothetical protein